MLNKSPIEQEIQELIENPTWPVTVPTITFIGDFPNNRWGMLTSTKKGDGYSRRCRACKTLFISLREAQAHPCSFERQWRVNSRHYLPETQKPIRHRARTLIRVEQKKGLVRRLLSMVGLG